MSFFQYLLFYKPYRVLCQFSPEGDKLTLADYLHGIGTDIYPVGRLDYDSEGLLLLTNDKRMNQLLLHPAHHYEKEYWVQVEGIPDESQLQALAAGVDISVNGHSYHTQPAVARRLDAVDVPERNPPIRFRKHLPDSWISLTITEGKNRQIRRMTAAVGLPTLRLLRHSIGNISIGGLKPGAYRKMAENEIKSLKKIY